MTTAWLDTNVVVRYFTGSPEHLAERARRLLARAEAGEITLRLTPIVVAEIVWVLRSVYGHEPAAIAAGLSALLRADGIAAEQHDTVVEALDLMMRRHVAFPDAFVAVSARLADEPVCTFDGGFKRLDVEILG